MKLLTPLLLMLTSMLSGQLQATPLKVGVSFVIPPYVIEGENRGIELDLLKEAFAGSGYEPSLNFCRWSAPSACSNQESWMPSSTSDPVWLILTF